MQKCFSLAIPPPGCKSVSPLQSLRPGAKNSEEQLFLPGTENGRRDRTEDGRRDKKKTAVRGGLRSALASDFPQERFYNFIAWIENQRIKQLGEQRINRVHIQYQRFFDCTF
ncbi:MAG: hypothetical protein R6U78_12775 [Bacteroidales bacterium]